MDTSPPSHAPGIKRADILVIDDDAMVLRTVERVLVANGYTVEKTSDGQAAARDAIAGSFDVIISDIHMPGITGTEILDVLRTYGCDVPVVLMTGSPTLESAREAIEFGAVQYLTKPVESSALIRAVKRAQKARRTPEPPAVNPAHTAGFERSLVSLWMAFQPIVSLSARGIFAYEALVRSREPGFMGPAQLLSHAERTMRLPDLGRAIRELCANAIARLPKDALLFVNVHADDLSDAELFAPGSPLSRVASRVVLEITERGAIDQVTDALERMRRLRALGFRIAIDDLGAGYAGLTSVAMLEPDFVKLDMSLTRDLSASPLRKRLVGSMIEACRDVGMSLVAEGVETIHELNTLRELGCDLLQGYHFGRPVPEFAKVSF